MSKTKSRYSPFLRQCFVTGAVCCDVIGHGCNLGYPAVLVPQLSTPDAVMQLTEQDTSWIVSVMGIAMMVGIAVTPPLMGRLGRKPAHYIVILATTGGWFLFSLATSWKELIIGRILQGLSFGIFTPLRSILIGEYTSPVNRGAFLTTISLAQGFGIMLVHLIGSYLSWQRTALVCTIFPFTSLIMTMYSPESPSWLADKGKYEECRKVFYWLRGEAEEKELGLMIQASLTDKKQSNVQKVSNLRRLAEIIMKKEFFKPIIVMCHAYCMMSFSGATILPNFTPKIITWIVGPDIDVSFWMVSFDIQRIITNLAGVYVINKIRRRTMIFSTLGACIVINLVIAAYVLAKFQGIIDCPIWIPIVLINIHYFILALGMVSLPMVIAGEIFPIAYRSLGGSIGTISYGCFMFVGLQTFLGLLDNIGLHGAYMIYAGILSYNFVILWFMLPETKGKTLQEIEDEFKGVLLGVKDVEVKQPLQNVQ